MVVRHARPEEASECVDLAEAVAGGAAPWSRRPSIASSSWSRSTTAGSPGPSPTAPTGSPARSSSLRDHQVGPFRMSAAPFEFMDTYGLFLGAAAERAG